MLENLPALLGKRTSVKSSILCSPVHSVSFQNLSVTTKTGLFRRAERTLLSSISGYVRQGQMLYVMGHSGCGKSTLLDTLYGKIKISSGEILIEGKQLSHDTLDRLRYVPQHDQAFASLSVREVFDFERCCFGHEKDSIEDTANALGLLQCLNTRYGDSSTRGLSSGQKRRVSVGVALLSRPGALLLDEPTSGLDVQSATSLMTYLRRICDVSRLPMIVVIHQPTQEIFELCDYCLILCEGRQGYFGPPGNLDAYMERVGHPITSKNVSVCEWAVNLMTRGVSKDIADECLKSWAERGEPNRETDVGSYFDVKTNDGHSFARLIFLMKRRVHLIFRDPSWIGFRTALYWMISFYVATLWLHIDSSLAENIPDTTGLLCFVMLFLPFLSVSVVPAYVHEIGVTTAEISRGTYSVWIFVVEHLLFEIFFLFFLSVSCAAIFYFGSPLLMSASSFWIFSSGLFVTLLASDSLMFLLSTVFRNFLVAVTLGCLLFGVYFCVCSYFIPVQDIGWYWQWIKYINILYYSCSIAVVNQFQSQAFPSSCVQVSECFPVGVNGTQIIDYYGYDQRIWIPFLALCCIILIFRMGHLLVTFYWKAKRVL